MVDPDLTYISRPPIHCGQNGDRIKMGEIMSKVPLSRIGKRAANDPWDLASYALKEKRVELVDRLNHELGQPSEAMALLQNEFLLDEMPPDKMAAFVEVCNGLISTSQGGVAGNDAEN